jgi:hypothetical protein
MGPIGLGFFRFEDGADRFGFLSLEDGADRFGFF